MDHQESVSIGGFAFKKNLLFDKINDQARKRLILKRFWDDRNDHPRKFCSSAAWRSWSQNEATVDPWLCVITFR